MICVSTKPTFAAWKLTKMPQTSLMNVQKQIFFYQFSWEIHLLNNQIKPMGHTTCLLLKYIVHGYGMEILRKNFHNILHIVKHPVILFLVPLCLIRNHTIKAYRKVKAKLHAPGHFIFPRGEKLWNLLDRRLISRTMSDRSKTPDSPIESVVLSQY